MHDTIKNDALKVIEKVNFEKLKNKSILITGASGLVGVHLVACLKQIQEKLNVKIFCWIRGEIEPEFKDIFEGCNIIKGDITDDAIFKTIAKFDYIIHAAGYAQPSKFLEDKIKTIQLNTTSTIKLFDLLNPDGTFLFVSTSEIYSGIEHIEIQETEVGNTNTDHPRSCYIEGKRSGESICHAYSQKGMNVKIARLSSAYGPGTKKDDKRVLNSLIRKGLVQEKIDLLDTGSAIRTFCYSSDVSEMLFNILLNSNSVLYNVGGIHEKSIFELAQSIGKILSKPVVRPNDNSGQLAGNPKTVHISIQKYLEEFSKPDFISFENGLSNTIEWQKYQLKGKI